MTPSPAAPGPLRRDLHEDWTLSIVDGPAPLSAQDIPAEVPGTLITDLLAAGLIEDPYLDRNEHDLAWTGECDVVYRTRFTAEDPGGDRVDLVAASLDTAATVVLNGQRVATVQNQHRSWRFDVTDLVRAGTNDLEIRFASPLRTARENQAVLGDLPVVGNDLPYNAIRKMACNFGWDWGPVLVTSGIAGPIGLEQWSVARIEQLRPRVTVDDGRGAVALHARIERAEASAEVPLELAARVLDPAGTEVAAARVTDARDALDLALAVEDPQRWWPRGYGEQPLYTVEVTLREADGTVRDRREHRIAFRTAGVVEEADEIGTSFTVVVNDRPILAKGANWIPDDCFPTRLGAADYAASVADAVDAGMNMLRIWGGGLYESDLLYDLCDELGLLVWQDFTTACAAYSELEPLRSEFEAEARENIVRLAWHPSLVHWNGSNENVEGYYHWGWKETIEEGTGWGLGYYTELFPALLAELDPTRSYTPTSPYSRPLPEDPRNPDHGTVHNWVAWASEGDNDYERYRDTVPRFSAEFGYQGPANHATLARAVTERPLDPDSPTMLSHQKAVGGQDKLRRGFARHLPAPEGFDDFHATTQLNQARALICGIGHYRSHWPVCGGTIVWQLNDCWPVVSWAAVDGDGRRKLLWYALRDLYAPVLLTVQPRPDGPAISLGNDTDEEITGRALLRRQDHAGTVLAETALEVHAAPRTAVTIPVPAALAEPADPADEVLVVALEGRPERTVHFFAEDVDSHLPDGALTATARACEDGVELGLAASATVRDLCVHADRVAPDAVSDRQLVTLLPGERTTVRVRTAAAVDPAAFLDPTVLVSANDLLARAQARAG
ncbi:glycoside hydrolase family 2 protein [Brachybacterium sp. YJGR34]|uniref:glycoside hydrolase family 2 protein n=1 Tax=Brachybacterium sp. YJGR34 TaxID=2059911 RepID=UPI000E0BFD74|nr:glycoside hydrolase family 2 protein [Brachybacterium sp. YJGR34]